MGVCVLQCWVGLGGHVVWHHRRLSPGHAWLTVPLAPPLCSTRDLAFAWGLALVCCTHHVGHLLHALGLHQFAHTGACALPAPQCMHALVVGQWQAAGGTAASDSCKYVRRLCSNRPRMAGH